MKTNRPILTDYQCELVLEMLDEFYGEEANNEESELDACEA